MKCELCRRDVDQAEEHHLIPRTTHSSKWVRSRFTRDEKQVKVSLCQPCHSTIHSFFTAKQLARSYSTLDLLRSDSDIAAFVKWVRRRAPTLRIKVAKKQKEGI